MSLRYRYKFSILQECSLEESSPTELSPRNSASVNSSKQVPSRSKSQNLKGSTGWATAPSKDGTPGAKPGSSSNDGTPLITPRSKAGSSMGSAGWGTPPSNDGTPSPKSSSSASKGSTIWATPPSKDPAHREPGSKSRLIPPGDQVEPEDKEVVLNIYHLTGGLPWLFAKLIIFMNYILYLPGIPFVHVGLEAYGMEYTFMGGENYGMETHVPRTSHLGPLWKTVPLGHTNLNSSQFLMALMELTDSDIFRNGSYRILTKNCNRYSYHLAEVLGVSENYPEWTGGLAALAQRSSYIRRVLGNNLEDEEV